MRCSTAIAAAVFHILEALSCAGASVDIKKTSYKKLSKLLSTFEKKVSLAEHQKMCMRAAQFPFSAPLGRGERVSQTGSTPVLG